MAEAVAAAEAVLDGVLQRGVAAGGLLKAGSLDAVARGWERSAEFAHAVTRRLALAPSGSFRDEAAAQLCGGLLVELATHPQCGPERVLGCAPEAWPPRLWDALCQVIVACAADERLSDRRRAETFSRILFAVNALPQQMAQQVTERARRGVGALTALLDSSPRGARFVLLSGSAAPTCRGEDSHWILAPVILRAAHRRRKLGNALHPGLLRPIGCTQDLLDLAIAAPPLAGDEYLALTPHAAEDVQRRATATVREFLKHNAEQDWIRHTLCAGKITGAGPELGKAGVAKVLEAALAAEIGEALRLCNGALAANAEGKGFERWIQLSDLLYACSRDSLISLAAVLTAVSEQRNDDLDATQLFTGGRASVWLLAQASTEALKNALTADARRPTPTLLPAFIHSFGEPRGDLLSAEGGGGVPVWDWLPEAGLYSTLFRVDTMYKLKDRAAAQDHSVVSEAATKVFPKVKETCSELSQRSLKREAQCLSVWHITTTTPVPGTTMPPLSDDVGDPGPAAGSAGVGCFATLSHMMATQVSEKLYRLLTSPEIGDPTLAQVPIRPGGQSLSPHRQTPLPLRILAGLSVPCRYKLRDQLDTALASKAVGRGVWETYSRLLFLTPRSCFHCEIVKEVRGIVTVLAMAPFVNVLELVELRLLRLLARLVNRGTNSGGGGQKEEGSALTFVVWLWRHYTTLAGKMSVSTTAVDANAPPPTAADPMDSLRLSVYVEIQEVLLALLIGFPQLLVGTELTASSVSVKGWNPFLPRVGVRAALTALRSEVRGAKPQAGLVKSLSHLSEATNNSAAGSHTAQLKSMHSIVHPQVAAALSGSAAAGGSSGAAPEKAAPAYTTMKGDHMVYYAVNSMKLRAAVIDAENPTKQTPPGLPADLALIALLKRNRATKPTTVLSPPPTEGSAIVAGGTAMTPDEHLSLEMVLALSWYLYAVQVPSQLQPEYINVESVRGVVAGLGGRALLEAAPAVLNYIIMSTPPRPTNVGDNTGWGARANFNMALSRWVWQWKLLPFSAVVLYLGEVLSAGQPQTADAAHHHLEYLLVKDNALTERLDWLVEKGPITSWWREDDGMRKEEEFRVRFPPPIGSAMSSMTECERMLPTFDIVLGCLIESASAETQVTIRHNLRTTLSNFVGSVVPKIYPFHATGVGFLLRVLSTYYNCPVFNAPLKDALIKGVLGGVPGTDPASTPLLFFCPDLCGPAAVEGASPRAQRVALRKTGVPGTIEHLAAALERAAVVWRPVESGTASGGAGSISGDDTTTPVVATWPSWEDLTFGEFHSVAEAAVIIPRLEFLRAAAPWEWLVHKQSPPKLAFPAMSLTYYYLCYSSAPGEKPLASPKKSDAAESMMEDPQPKSVVLGNLIAAAVRGPGDGEEGSAARQPTATARVALAAMVLDRLPVEMQHEVPAHCIAYLEERSLLEDATGATLNAIF